jgi:hypothetical protein
MMHCHAYSLAEMIRELACIPCHCIGRRCKISLKLLRLELWETPLRIDPAMDGHNPLGAHHLSRCLTQNAAATRKSTTTLPKEPMPHEASKNGDNARRSG